MKKHNLILITSHDLGRHLGCYGVEGSFSPNLDRFAKDNIRFDKAFCTQSQCSPSRASLYTGRFPHANGVMGLVHGAFAWDLHSTEKHLAGILQSDGYQTALAGLQHETRHPERMGFDTIRLNQSGNHAEGTAEIANQFLANFATDRETPFYLQIGFFEPHRRPGHPNHDFGPMPADDVSNVKVPGFLLDTAEAKQEFAQMQGAIREMDRAVGSILSRVEQLGLSDDTIILFTTDHGIPFPRAKTSLYDPGLEVALMMKCPWAREPRVITDLVSNVDILPTLLDFLGIETPDDIQGRSFAPLLNGSTHTSRDAIFGEQTYHNYCDPMRCIRTETHKLIVNFMPCANIYNSTQQWCPLTTTTVPANPKNTPHVPIELYDLSADPLEHNNLADSPEHAGIRQELLKRLHLWMQKSGDPLLEGMPLPKRFYEAQALIKNA